MISEAREKYWNYRRYEDGPSLKERRPILYELEKQLGSSRGTTYIINTLERKRSNIFEGKYKILKIRSS